MKHSAKAQTARENYSRIGIPNHRDVDQFVQIKFGVIIKVIIDRRNRQPELPSDYTLRLPYVSCMVLNSFFWTKAFARLAHMPAVVGR